MNGLRILFRHSAMMGINVICHHQGGRLNRLGGRAAPNPRDRPLRIDGRQLESLAPKAAIRATHSCGVTFAMLPKCEMSLQAPIRCSRPCSFTGRPCRSAAGTTFGSPCLYQRGWSAPLGTSGHFTETTAYDPKSPYSASKTASDRLVPSPS